MNVLLLGSGGRESAFAWKLNQSKLLNKLYIAPGNAGTIKYGTNINLKETEFESIAEFCLKAKINMIVVGPEIPLAKGIVDFFKLNQSLSDISIIGPSKIASSLESSKDFAKKFMNKYNIPTAKHATFDKSTCEEAIEFLKSIAPPYVIKADGLAAGKGVIIPNTIEEAIFHVKNILLENIFGESGNKVVIEEFLDGIELSMFILTDGEEYLILPEAKDYKRIGIGNTGLNTGGMGSISPVPFADNNFKEKVIHQIINPTINGLKSENIPYCGFIFFGLIKVGDNPYVIEYNVRMGDPETESVLPRINNDLLELLIATSKKQLNKHTIDINPKSATTVMMVSGGYPEEYEKGFIIDGIDQTSNSLIFHAGTSLNTDNNIITSGGRVLAITCIDSDSKAALKNCYKIAEKINFNNSYVRTDIGFDIL